jgi:hypothetical protein
VPRQVALVHEARIRRSVRDPLSLLQQPPRMVHPQQDDEGMWRHAQRAAERADQLIRLAAGGRLEIAQPDGPDVAILQDRHRPRDRLGRAARTAARPLPRAILAGKARRALRGGCGRHITFVHRRSLPMNCAI